ncbi:MAG TPA: glycoside hydrolase family 9 protein, partial [Acidobacteriaceae bacterium]|nr:glycoside hydrolase family 9 protein [Acidobacteriaceae bacterium]
PLDALKIEAPTWDGVGALAYWSYALAGEKSPDASVTAIQTATLKTAQKLLHQSAENGYGNTLAVQDYIWGSNGVAANHSLLLLLANHFQPDPALVDGALNNLHYLLGRNCLGISWVTQLGARPFQHPHHRPSIADHIAAPWPGLLSGGPNAHPADRVAVTVPQSPPMRMYIDNDQAYSMNEVAINWNAPLVFLLAAAHSLRT